MASTPLLHNTPPGLQHLASLASPRQATSPASDFSNEHLLLVPLFYPLIHLLVFCISPRQEHLQKCVERPPWEHQCFECGKEFESAHGLLIHGHTCSERLLVSSI